MKKAFLLNFLNGIFLKLKKLIASKPHSCSGLSPLSVVPAPASILPKGRTLRATSIGRRLLEFPLATLALTLTACNYFTQETMTEVFSRSTEIMEVVRMDLVGNQNIYKNEEDLLTLPRGEYAFDKDDVKSIPSSSDYRVNYIIKNPQGFEFKAEITNASDGISTLKNVKNPYTYSIGKDFTYISVFLSAEMLYKMECGGTITPLVKIICPEYGDIPLYEENIRANSRPPLVQCAVPMINMAYEDVKKSTIGTYVLCFNLPEVLFDCDSSHELDGIHCDVQTIRIENLSGYSSSDERSRKIAAGEDVALNLFWDNEINEWTYNLPSKVKTTLSVNVYNNVGVNRSNGMPAAMFYPGKYPVYISDTRYAHQDDAVEWKITMTDLMGIESTLVVGNTAKQLCPVEMTDADGNVITNDNNGIHGAKVKLNENEQFDMVLMAPTRTLGTAFEIVRTPQVVYEVWNTTGNATKKLVTQGISDGNTFSFTMEKGATYTVNAYSHKDGYIDSALTTWIVDVGVESVEISVVWKPIQYYVDFKLKNDTLYASDFNTKQGRTVSVIMTVRDIDTNAVVNSGYALSDFSVYVSDSGQNYIPTDVETSSVTEEMTFTLPEWLYSEQEGDGISGVNEWQVYPKVNLINQNYSGDDKGYSVGFSGFLKLTVIGG